VALVQFQNPNILNFLFSL